MEHIKKSKGRRVFEAINYFMIAAVVISCLIPILNLLALSFSSSQAIMENRVGLLPVDFSFKAYHYVLKKQEFWNSIWITAQRVFLGVPLNVLMIVLVAYPLSKSAKAFPARKYYVAYMLVIMLFSGGLMPTYYIVSKTGLIDTIWSLLLPGAVPVFSCIVLMNFFRGIPEELEESARLDGANQLQILVKIFLPLSKPSIATVTLFSLVSHWNSWFDGLIYSNYTTNYPLQSYLQTLVTSVAEVVNTSDLQALMERNSINNTNLKAAQIFISIIPLMIIYPWLQKYFTTGLTLGSVKG